MLLILIDSKHQINNYISALNGKKSQQLSPSMWIVSNSQLLPMHAKIALSYLPLHFYTLTGQLNTEYHKFNQTLKNFINQFVSQIWLGSNSNDYLIWQLNKFINDNQFQNRYQFDILVNSSNSEVIKSALQQPKQKNTLTHHISLAFKNNLKFNQKFNQTVLPVIQYKIKHKINLLPSEILVLNHINQNIHQNKCMFRDTNHQLWSRSNCKPFGKHDITGTVKVLNITSHTLTKQPPFLLDLIHFCTLVAHRASCSAMKAFTKGIEPLYYQFHLCTNIFTQNNTISLKQLQVISSQLSTIQEQYFNFTGKKYQLNPNFNVKRYVSSDNKTNAILPTQNQSDEIILSLPSLVQLSYKVLLESVLQMFSQNYIYQQKTVTGRASGGDKKIFKTKINQPVQKGWTHYLPSQKVNNYQPNQMIKYTFIPCGVTVDKLLTDFIEPFHIWNLATILIHIHHLVQSQAIDLSNPKADITLSNAVPVLDLLNQHKVRAKLLLNVNTFNLMQYKLAHQQNKDRQYTSQFQKIIQSIHALNKDKPIIYKIPHYTQATVSHTKDNTHITCPNCKKGTLILCKTQYQNGKTNAYYVCSKHCGVKFPMQLYSFTITPLILTLILQNMCAPIKFQTQKGQIMGKIIYYHHTLAIKRVSSPVSY